MALQLMKVQATASSTITVTPQSERFFYVTTIGTAPGGTLTIDAANFFQDSGAAATELPALESSNSYVNVYINGALQMSGIYTYTPGATTVGSLEVQVPALGGLILSGSSIVVEVVNFVPTASTTIET